MNEAAKSKSATGGSTTVPNEKAEWPSSRHRIRGELFRSVEIERFSVYALPTPAPEQQNPRPTVNGESPQVPEPVPACEVASGAEACLMLFAVDVDSTGSLLICNNVVVIIIGILAAIAIPVFLSQRENAESNAARADVRTAGTAEQAAYTETGAYVAASALGPYGFNAADATPTVTGGVGATDDVYCIQATSGGDTWYMDETRGAPSNTAC